jgi:hypothetical protein
MQLYRVIKTPFPVGPGAQVSLDAEQAKVRAHNLKPFTPPAEGERVEVETVNAIEFKSGEIIGVTDVPKGLADRLQSPDAPKPEPEPQPDLLRAQQRHQQHRRRG